MVVEDSVIRLTRAQARAVAHYTHRYGRVTLAAANGDLIIYCDGLAPHIVPDTATDWPNES